MVRHGEAPFLECSSRGDKRFSAFYARVKSRGNKTIEELYQSAKVFKVGGREFKPQNWRNARGNTPINLAEVRALYAKLWDEYVEENPHLLQVICAATGLSDMFGSGDSACQATELWRIRNNNIAVYGWKK